MQVHGLTIRIVTEVRATEDPEKVKTAIMNIFPDVKFGDVEGGRMEAEAHDLSGFKEHIRKQRIRDTVRTSLRKNTGTDGITLTLSKQAAYAGRVSLSEGEGPLGDLEIMILSRDPESLIEEMTEKEEDDEAPDQYEGPGIGD
jgi:predicted RNA binding protein with dsRBD fold (UPF0201 family)